MPEDWDDATWMALGATLTVVGLALSALVWKRKGAASGLRGVAWSLLPLAAAMTRTLRLFGEFAESLVDYVLGLTFSPVVWLGLVVAGVSVLLFVISGAMRSRGVGTRTRGTGEGKQAVTATSTRPAAAKPGGSTQAVDDDMADIEAILRRRGIT